MSTDHFSALAAAARGLQILLRVNLNPWGILGKTDKIINTRIHFIAAILACAIGIKDEEFLIFNQIFALLFALNWLAIALLWTAKFVMLLLHSARWKATS